MKNKRQLNPDAMKVLKAIRTRREQRMVAKFETTNGDILVLFAVARQVRRRWQGGVSWLGETHWHNIYANTAHDALTDICSKIVIDSDGKNLIIRVVTK